MSQSRKYHQIISLSMRPEACERLRQMAQAVDARSINALLTAFVMTLSDDDARRVYDHAIKEGHVLPRTDPLAKFNDRQIGKLSPEQTQELIERLQRTAACQPRPIA